MTGRVVLGGLGAAAAAYGGVLLAQRGVGELLAVGAWLAGGVVAHDAVLAPLTVVAGVVAARWLPGSWRGALARVVVLLGPLTLLAIPVLGRFGARADNPTLLDRPYWSGWVAMVVLGLIGAGAVTAYERRAVRRATRRTDLT